MPDKTENLAKKISRSEQRRQNFWQQVFQPTIFGKKNRNYRRLPGYKREKRGNLVKRLKSRNLVSEKVFTEEIAVLLGFKRPSVAQYLVNRGYIKNFTPCEFGKIQFFSKN